MRNLKRALSLALASVMLLGMMVVGTSAKGLDDFGDAAEINNADAVAVTSEIGIFKGYDDGEFKPENAVTRAEMAVIIAKMLYGADVKADQFAEIDTFTDVPAWAEGYVNLVASLGIVAGRGNGIFDPNATVTTAEAAMMLTKALGYFQNAKDFGSDWMLAATAKATELGLYGDMKLSAKAPLNRENVAVMVFNALTKAVPVQYNELLGVYYNENQGIIYSLEFNYLQTLGYKNFDLVYKTNTETMYGRPATTWGFGTYNSKTDAGSTTKLDVLTEDGGLIASKVRMLSTDEIVTIANVPTYVYTAGTKDKDVYKDLGASVCSGDYYWVAYVNGTEVDAELPAKNSSAEYDYTGEGTVTEIYIDDADEIVTVVEINYYMGQVTKVKATDDAETITIKVLSDGAKLDDKTFEIAGYEEDDYVIFTIDENEDGDAIIGEVFTPATVTGDVTRVESDKNTGNTYLRVEGEKYVYSQGIDADEPEQQEHMVYELGVNEAEPAHPTLDAEYVLYLDPNGYVIAFDEVTTEATEYLYVVDSDEELKDWIAKVELTDATQTKVEVEYDTIAFIDGDKDKGTNIDGLIWKYSVDKDGNYELTYINKYAEANDKFDEWQHAKNNVTINNGEAYIDDGVNHYIVDKKTLFVDTVNNVTYTGYNEVPNVDNAKIAFVADGKIAEVVFILAGNFYDADSTYFMLAGTTRESLKYDKKHYWDYSKAYINGEKVEDLYVRYNALSDNETVLSAGQLYQVKKTIDEDYIIEVVEFNGEKVNVSVVGDDAFWVTTKRLADVKYTCDEETIFVLVETDVDGDISISVGDIADLKADEGYTIQAQIVDDNDQYAELVYIYKTELAEESEDEPEIVENKVNYIVAMVNPTTGELTGIEYAKAGTPAVGTTKTVTLAEVAEFVGISTTKLVAYGADEVTFEVTGGTQTVVLYAYYEA